MNALCETRDDVLPTFYGRSFEVDLPRYEHLGPLSQEGVAKNVRRSALLLDASLFQGFGRPGLEAMACGTPGVLTDQGGINEYARDGLNCIQFDPTDVQAGVDAANLLLDDRLMRESVIQAGLRTAAHYDSELEADRTFELFQRITS